MKRVKDVTGSSLIEKADKGTVLERNISDDDDDVEWEDQVGDEEENKLQLGLVGRIWTERNVNPGAFMNTIKSIWALKFGMEISNIGKNKFLFQFHHWRDKKKVLDGQPWHFDHYALLLGEVRGMDTPSEINLYHLPVWARFYNVPFKGCQNENNAIILGNKVGEFLAQDKRDCIGMEKSMRIRVLLDVRKPLKKYINLKMRGGCSNRVTVKYEKLPLFFFTRGNSAMGRRIVMSTMGKALRLRIFMGI